MRKKTFVFAMAAAVALMTAGCQSKYEKVEVPGNAAEAPESAGEKQKADGENQQAGGKSQTEGKDQQADGVVNEKIAQNDGSESEKQQAEVSVNKTELTTESAPSMEARNETVYVKATTLNLRVAPEPGAEVVAAPVNGTQLKRTGDNGNWSQVEYQGKTCYAASAYLSTEQPEEQSAALAQPAGNSGSAMSSDSAASSGSAASVQNAGEVGLNMDWKYASLSKINSGKAVLYRSESASRKNKVVCVNAGHGTSGGSSVKTQCHPDGTPKVTSGTTSAGATTAVAVSGGMTFADGTPEAKVTLAMAKVLKDKLLAKGYDVLMIRESDDVQLDNVARTVLANNLADCHIALHWDSTKSNKGAFYMSVPNVASYRAMEPVASHWKQHNALGESLVAGLKSAGVKIFSGGSMEMDLTQTSYSTVPSIDIELGDGASDHSAATLDQLGNGLVAGVDQYFGN